MKVFFFDIDGTLAENGVMPDSTKFALEQLRKLGHSLWICSGRGMEYVQEHFGPYIDGIICSNGREAYIHQKKIYDQPLSPAQLQPFEQAVLSSGAGYLYMSKEESIYEGPQEGRDEMQKYFPSSLKSRSQLSQTQIYSIALWVKDETHLQNVQEALRDIAIVNPHFPAHSADVTIRGVTKGTAIAFITTYLHVKKEDTYAFGDGMNDIAMFEAVAHSIAMGNGQPQLKEKAAFITRSIHEDGILFALQHYRIL